MFATFGSQLVSLSLEAVQTFEELYWRKSVTGAGYWGNSIPSSFLSHFAFICQEIIAPNTLFYFCGIWSNTLEKGTIAWALWNSEQNNPSSLNLLQWHKVYNIPK